MLLWLGVLISLGIYPPLALVFLGAIAMLFVL